MIMTLPLRMTIDTALNIVKCIRKPSEVTCDKNFGRALSTLFKEIHAIGQSEDIIDRLISALNTDAFINFYNEYVQLLCEPENIGFISAINVPVTNFIRLQKILWNITDASEDLCYKLTCHKLPSVLFKLLQKPHLRLDDFRSSVSAGYICCEIIHSCVAILYNMVFRFTDLRHMFRTVGALDILKSIITDWLPIDVANDASANKEIQSCRTMCILLFSLLIDKNECNVIHNVDKHMEYILKGLQDSLNSETLHSYTCGFHAVELLNGLIKLVSPEVSRKIIVEAVNQIEKVLDIAMNIKQFRTTAFDTERDTPDFLAATALEFLAVLPNCRLYMAVGSSLREKVERFASETWSEKCPLITKSILWMIAEPLATDSSTISVEHLLRVERKLLPVNAHLFISCAHTTKFLMRKVYHELKKRNYSVLFDENNFHFDTMAESIKNASGIILGICQKFKRSKDCKLIVYYAYQLKIPRFVLNLDPTCVLDGWLAFSIAQTTSIPLHNQNSIGQAVDQLVDQLGQTGKLRSSNDYGETLDFPDQSSSTAGGPSMPTVLAPGHSKVQSHLDYHTDIQGDGEDRLNLLSPDEFRSLPPLSPACVSRVSLWKSQEVIDWLTKQGLAKYVKFTADWDGLMLTELASLYLSVPDHLSTCLREDLCMPLLDQLRFNAALVELFQISMSARLSTEPTSQCTDCCVHSLSV